MKYKSIFNVCLLTAFLLTATTSCDDWTEMEIHETDVNGAKEQNPEQYSVYTQNIRAYKATKHAVVYAGLTMLRTRLPVKSIFSVPCRTVLISYPCAMPTA